MTLIAKRKTLAVAVGLGLSVLAAVPLYAAFAKPAVNGPYSFEPLVSSAVCESEPLAEPFTLPAGFSQSTIETQSSDPAFADLPDMNQVNETGPQSGRYLYRTHEVSTNGSVSVTDLETGETEVLAQRADWERFDGLKWTPWQTLLAAEEVGPAALPDPDFPTAVNGLVYEIDPVTGDAIARPALGSLSHEGIGLDEKSNVYVIDEFVTGGIFKFVPDNRGDLSSGQLYALKITDETAAPGAKTGAGTWLPLDQDDVQVNARAAALAAGASTYNRPEDVEIIKNVLYVAITGEDRIISVQLDVAEPMVREFVAAGDNVPVEVDDEGVNGETDEVTGLNSPDNLASDSHGNLFIAEDNDPGDIWVATPDKGNGDGYADSVVLFASLSDCAAEPTGIYFAPGESKALYVNVQHAGGSGDDRAMVITKD